MTIMFDVISIISIAGIGTGLTMAILLITLPQGRFRASIWFALFVVFTSYSIFTAGFSTYTGLYYKIPHTICTAYAALLFLGPLLYFYFRELLSSENRFAPRSLLHLLPVPLFLLVFNRFYFAPAAYKIAFLNRWAYGHILPGDRLTGLLLPLPFLIQAPVYLLVIALMIRKFHNSLKGTFSDADNRKTRWGKQVILLTLIPTVIMVTLLILTSLNRLAARHAFRIIPIIVSLFLVILSMNALLQPSLFRTLKTLNLDENKERNKKGTSNPFPSPYSEGKDFKRLTDIMTTKAHYRDPELTLPDLADKLDIKRCNLSWLINNKTGKNFYDFINGYRLKEVLKEMNENPDGVLMNIAYAAGFSAKSTFYKFFKSATGKTPGEYFRKKGI